MKSRLRPKLSYANVIASIALFVALGGAAVAAGLPKGSVGPRQLKRGAVTAAAIRKGAVTAGKLAPKAVTPGKIGPNAVGPSNIGNGAITSAKLGANSVIASSIKNGVVTTNKLTNANVTTAKLADGSVTNAKLGAEVGPLLGTLKTGQTLRGVFAVGDVAAGIDQLAYGSVSYPFPLSGAPPAVSILKKGQTNANCAGIGSGSAPAATAGNLCIYLTEEVNVNETTPLEAVNNQRLGFGFAAKSKAAGSFAAYGQWAVTAP